MTKAESLQYLRQAAAELQAAKDRWEDANLGPDADRILRETIDELTNAAAYILTRFAEFEQKEERVAA